jgi:hypothetical protein
MNKNDLMFLYPESYNIKEESSGVCIDEEIERVRFENRDVLEMLK